MPSPPSCTTDLDNARLIYIENPSSHYKMQQRTVKRVSPKSGIKAKGRGLINSLINKLPFELHLPSYNFCGPGTRLEQRLARGDQGVNQLDEACKTHDIAYSQFKDLESRHIADKQLQKAALDRFRAKDSTWKERLASLFVAGIMKGKTTFGMGVRRKRSLRKRSHRKRKAVGLGFKKRRSTKGIKKKRVIQTPKIGGFIFSIPLLLSALGALGGLAGGASAIAKTVQSKKNEDQTLEETKRHNKAMEQLVSGKGIILPFKKKLRGKGLYLRPYKKGMGMYLRPYSKNYR